METDNLEPVLANAEQQERRKRLREEADRLIAEQEAAVPTVNDQVNAQPKDDGGGLIDNVVGGARAVAADLGEGAIESVGAVIQGARDGAQEALDLVAEVDKKAADLLGFWPGVQLTDPETGKVDVKFVNLANVDDENVGLQLPDPGFEQDTVTGNAVRSVAQFAAGFKGVDKLTKSLGVLKQSNLTSAAIKGAITDFVAFDGNEGRLADIAAEVHGFGDLVPEFLQTQEDDSEIVGRIKNTLEGAGLGVAFDTVMSGLRAYKGQKRAVAALQEAEDAVKKVEGIEQQRATETTAKIEAISGNPRGDRVQRHKSDGPGDPDRFAPNLARINSSDDIKKTIDDMVKKHSDEVDAGRRGIVKQRTALEEAAHIDAWGALQGRGEAQTLSQAETVAVRELWATSADNVQNAAQAHLLDKSDATTFALHRAVNVHRAIQAEVMGARAEAGRILNAWSIPVGDNLARMRDIEGLLSSESGASFLTDKMAARLATLGGDQIKALDHTISNAAQKSADAFGEAWRFSLLSNPKTHVVNAIGNMSVIVGDILETSLGGRIGQLFGDETTSELVEEAALKASAFRSAVGDQFKYFSENKRFNNFGVTPEKVDAKRTISAGAFGQTDDSVVGASLNAIGRVLTVPQELLGGADDFFKGVNFKAELSSQAHRIATQEVRTGQLARGDIGTRMAELISEPSPELFDGARQASLERTFTAPPKRGGVVQATMTFRKALNSSGIPLGHILLPFINTPANILKYVADRTPYGYFSLRQELQKGGKEAAIANAKIGLGTSSLFLAADMASNGQVTGGGPSDFRERQALQRQGWQPYSYKIGDHWFRYDRFDPIGSWLSIGADYHEILSNRGYFDGEDQDLLAVGGRMTGALGGALLSKTYLTGVSEFVNLLGDPDRHGPDYYKQIVSAFTVPAGVAEIRRQFDPQMRETASTLDAIKNRLPGGSNGLAQRRDLWGRSVSYQSNIGQFYDALSPFVARKIDPDPIDTELERLRFFPAMPNRSLSVPFGPANRRISVSLRNRPDIYSKLVELAGNETKHNGIGAKDFIDRFIQSPEYERLDDGSEPSPGNKAYAIRKIISTYRRAAQQEVISEFRSELEEMAKRQFDREQEETARQEAEAAAQLLQE